MEIVLIIVLAVQVLDFMLRLQVLALRIVLLDIMEIQVQKFVYYALLAVKHVLGKRIIYY
jgi:hypothetical protein